MVIFGVTGNVDLRKWFAAGGFFAATVIFARAVGGPIQSCWLIFYIVDP